MSTSWAKPTGSDVQGEMAAELARLRARTGTVVGAQPHLLPIIVVY